MLKLLQVHRQYLIFLLFASASAGKSEPAENDRGTCAITAHLEE